MKIRGPHDLAGHANLLHLGDLDDAGLVLGGLWHHHSLLGTWTCSTVTWRSTPWS
jgi:hypothetical protein